MRSKKFVLKTIAVFLAVNITTQVLAPTVAMALTSGPTTPEVSSFEPVDTTDMVDLATGDFNYNIPLLDIPGPEGGYPLALSYHGGVLPSQDASWVGLGWNINPGSINRTVNNFADDYLNAKYTVVDDWNGGITTQYNFGVGVGVSDVVTVGIDVGVKHDTYRGNGGSVGINAQVGFKGMAYVGAEVGIDGWSGYYGSASIGIGTRAAGIGLTVGSYGGGDNYASLGVASMYTQSSMGVSLSSGHLKTSSTIAGTFTGHNDNYGKISTSSGGFGVQIPISCFYVSVGYKYTRYWMHATDGTQLYGVLNSYAANAINSGIYTDVPYMTSSLDCNILYDPNKNVTLQTDLDWSTNPIVASYDNYTVLSQGLSGSMEPMMLDNGSFFRKSYTNPDNGSIKMKTDIYKPFTIGKHMFRFRNDFSNSHKVTPTDFGISGSTLVYPNSGLAYSTNQLNPKGITRTFDGSNKLISERIAGSKHIEYYTNAEIISGSAKLNGFINTPVVPNTERDTRTFTNGVNTSQTVYDVKSNIGGYSITNEKGVTYHYALPAYTYDFSQFTYSANSKTGSIRSRKVTNLYPYAYAWMLTAVTGPDYVDVNKTGFADVGDWGYWVNFDYGRWTDRYGYRTPDSGSVNTDVDGSTVTSKGAKEIYYLNAVATRSHTALFVKQYRLDGIGTNSFDYNSYFKTSNYHYPGVQNSDHSYNVQPYDDNSSYKPVRSLKLNEIMLFDNITLSTVLSQNGYTLSTLKQIYSTINNNSSYLSGDCNMLVHQSYVNGSPAGGAVTTYQPNVNWGNVIDFSDLYNNTVGTQLRNAAVKRIVLDQDDRTLCKNTSNSFDTDTTITFGRTALNSIRFYGKNQVQLLPSTNFKYDIQNPGSVSMAPTLVPGDPYWTDPRLGRIYVNTNSNVDPLKPGDILSFICNSITYYVSLTRIALPNDGASMQFDVLYLGKDILTPANKPIGSDGLVLSITAYPSKNPPYTVDFYDIWGMFKSDYSPVASAKRNKSRITTAVSSRAVDCWSLRSIETPTGSKINIEYESDDYKDVVLKNRQIYNMLPNIQIKLPSQPSFLPFSRHFYSFNAFFGSTTGQDFNFAVNPGDLQVPINQIFSVGDNIDIVSAGEYKAWTQGSHPPLNYSINKTTVQIIGITENSIAVRDYKNKICVPLNSFTFQSGETEYYDYSHAGSYFFAPDKQLHYGGGLRAKSIQVTDGVTSSQTCYQYKNTANNSSGSTAFDPLSYDELELIADYSATNSPTRPQYPVSVQNEYGAEYYGAFVNIMAIAKDVVAPGVLYESVKVKNNVTKNGVTTDAPTYQAFQFQPFNADMVKFSKTQQDVSMMEVGTSRIEDKTSQIGNLISIKTYDKNNRLLAEVSNTYTSTPENDQGIIEQVFHEQRRMNADAVDGSESRFGVVTVRSEYPSVLLSTTQKNYTKGITTTSNNTAFDFYTGAVTETQTTDSYGNTFVSISDPAYNYYGGMGLKVNNILNSNMLSQQAGAYTLKKTNTASVYGCTVTSTNNNIAPNEISITMGGAFKLPMNYHVGSKITGLTLPVFITSISDNRNSFTAISRASNVTSDIGSRGLLLDDANLLSASINTWNDNWYYRLYNGGSTFVSQKQTEDVTNTPAQKEKVWRKKSSFIWNSVYTNPDGSYMTTGVGAFTPFVYSTDYNTGYEPGVKQSFWQVLNTNTLFTPFSKPLESIDIDGKYSSTKYGGNGNEVYVLASAANARYTEFTQSGFEYPQGTPVYFEGEMSIAGGGNSTTYAHTGSYSCMLPGGKNASYTLPYVSGTDNQIGFVAGKNYKASVWTYASQINSAQLYAITIDNGVINTYYASIANTTPVKCGNWYLLTLTFTAPTTTLSTSYIIVGVNNLGSTGAPNVYFDDFRFQPDISSVTSYVYDQSTALLTHVIGNDNRYIRYEYDNKSRLKATYKETPAGEVKINEYNYNMMRGN